MARISSADTNGPILGAGAVFISYASEDMEAAGRIAATLEAAGIEVWLDKTVLPTGDAWDQKIRREIRDCALFIAVISRNTQRRTEGYFRLEWHLADQRTQQMAKSRSFLVPVCIDETLQKNVEVPDSFSRVHWSRMSAGQVPEDFVEHVRRMLAAGYGATQMFLSEALPLPVATGALGLARSQTHLAVTFIGSPLQAPWCCFPVRCWVRRARVSAGCR